MFVESWRRGLGGTGQSSLDFGNAERRPPIREAGSVVDIAALDNPDGRRHLVVVATTAGKAVGVEGHDDLPVTFAAGTLVDVAGFYDHVRQRHVVVAGLTDGTVHQAYWKATTVGIEELWAVPDV